MKTRHAFCAVMVLALLLFLAVASTASAATSTLPAVWVAGAVGFDNQGKPALAGFSAKGIGPALLGEDHQPAKGTLVYRDTTGTTFVVSVDHIHAHSATEVHFGGTITSSSAAALVGSFAHCVAVDGGTPGVRGDLFSILVNRSVAHEHGTPLPVSAGNLVVKAPGM